MATRVPHANARAQAARHITPSAASEAGRRQRALGTLGSNRQSPENVTPFQSFTRALGSPLSSPPVTLPNTPGAGDYEDNVVYNANPGGDPDDNPSNDPGDDPGEPAGDNPDDNPFQDDPPEDEPLEPILALAQAIDTLTRDVRRVRRDNESSGWTKLRESDQFDGTDPKKLRAFLIHGELNFEQQLRAFW